MQHVSAAAFAGAIKQGEGRRQEGWRLLAVLSLLLGFASISTDLYLPAMPTMQRALGAGAGTVEWTVSAYLAGFSLGQLVWGPIGDRFGRRTPVALGIVLFIVGSAGCALAGSIWTVIAWRLVQAAGASAAVVLGRAMVRDLFEGPRAAQMMATLMTIMAIAPLIGPLLGGQVLAFAGWRANFWALVVIGVLALGALFTLPETLPLQRRSSATLRSSLSGYAVLLCDRRLLGHAGAGGFFYGGMFAYIAGSPFAYIDVYGVSPQLYGLLFGAGVLGIMASNLVNARLVLRLGGDRLLVGGARFAAISGLTAAVAASTGLLGLWGLLVPLLLFCSATGFIVANSVSGALADHPHRAGAVSALVGALQYGSGIVGSALVGLLADGTPVPLGWLIALSGLGSVLCTRLLNCAPIGGPRALSRADCCCQS